MAKTQSNLDKKSRRATFQYALMRWESAVIIGGTILLSFFLPNPLPGWPVWGWPALGGFALVVIIVSSMTDTQTNTKVQLALFQEQFDLRKLVDSALQSEVMQALAYYSRIKEHASQQRSGLIKEHLLDTMRQLEDWVSNIYKLALQLDRYRHDPLLAQERESVPKELETLASRRHQEGNVEVGARLDEVIEGKRKQWDSLKALDERMQQAELQLEQSNTALATVYSQLQLIGAQDIQSGRSERLQQDIRDQIGRLNDLVSSINEVYDYQGN